jgi:hypothetical protein
LVRLCPNTPNAANEVETTEVVIGLLHVRRATPAAPSMELSRLVARLLLLTRARDALRGLAERSGPGAEKDQGPPVPGGPPPHRETPDDAGAGNGPIFPPLLAHEDRRCATREAGGPLRTRAAQETTIGRFFGESDVLSSPPPESVVSPKASSR